MVNPGKEQSKIKRSCVKRYLIHDNGGIPFIVEVGKKIISVFGNYIHSNHHFFDIPYSKVFIGKSVKNSMTIDSEDYGIQYDGNTVLFQNTSKDKLYEYTFIGDSIFRFKTPNKIMKYFSPIGRNDVPYPYAIDEKNNLILLAEKVIIKRPKLKPDNDYYNYYYEKIYTFPSKFIEKIYIGKESDKDKKIKPSLVTDPEKMYNNLTQNGKISLYFVYHNKKLFGEKRKMDKKTYIKTMKLFLEEAGVKALKTKTIIRRDYNRKLIE